MCVPVRRTPAPHRTALHPAGLASSSVKSLNVSLYTAQSISSWKAENIKIYMCTMCMCVCMCMCTGCMYLCVLGVCHLRSPRLLCVTKVARPCQGRMGVCMYVYWMHVMCARRMYVCVMCVCMYACMYVLGILSMSAGCMYVCVLGVCRCAGWMIAWGWLSGLTCLPLMWYVMIVNHHSLQKKNNLEIFCKTRSLCDRHRYLNIFYKNILYLFYLIFDTYSYQDCNGFL